MKYNRPDVCVGREWAGRKSEESERLFNVFLIQTLVLENRITEMCLFVATKESGGVPQNCFKTASK